jgi:hypothetical protein
LMLSFTYTGGQMRIWGRQPGRSRFAWSERRMYKVAVRRSDQLYHRAMELFGASPAEAELASLYITAYAVEPARTEQLALYESEDVRLERVEEAVNAVNDRYGELTLLPAAVAKSKNPMRDKIPFGTIRYFD